jgi:hypothetical protein
MSLKCSSETFYQSIARSKYRRQEGKDNRTFQMQGDKEKLSQGPSSCAVSEVQFTLKINELSFLNVIERLMGELSRNNLPIH